MGKEFLDRVQNMHLKAVKNSIDHHFRSSDILFSEDATIIHISGNKESSGRILKVS